jgi:ATP-dependent protease Clp ATPase subunit
MGLEAVLSDRSTADRRARMDTAPPRKIAYCSFCNRSQQEVANIVAGPGKVGSAERKLICNECVEQARAIFGAPRGASASAAETAGLTELRDEDHACSFCGRRLPGAHRLLAGAADACICPMCVALCAEINAEVCPSR